MKNKETTSKLYRLIIYTNEHRPEYGHIETGDGNTVVCYVPNRRMAELVLDALNDGVVRSILNK